MFPGSESRGAPPLESDLHPSSTLASTTSAGAPIDKPVYYSNTAAVDHYYVPDLYSTKGVHPIGMAAVDEPGTMENHDLVAKTEAMNLEDGGAFGHEGEETVPNGLMHGEHLDAAEDEDVADEAHETGGAEPEPVPAGLNGDATSVRTRPT